MCNLITIGKTIKYFSLITTINQIDLYMVGIKVHHIRFELYSIHFIHPHLIFNLVYKYSNILKSVLYLKKLAVS